MADLEVNRRRRPRPATARPPENPRPPRYRLLTAAAALPRRAADVPSESFERACPACGASVLFTQIVHDDGVEYRIAEHDCDGPGL